MKMPISWNYLGPFFDGEGCAGLYVYETRCNPQKIKIVPSIQITCFKENHVRMIIQFLKGEDISSSLKKRKDGKIVGLYINAWGSVFKFIIKIKEFTILKLEELLLMEKACEIYNALPEASKGGKKITENFEIFLPLARKIHDLKSAKGQYNRKSRSFY